MNRAKGWRIQTGIRTNPLVSVAIPVSEFVRKRFSRVRASGDEGKYKNQVDKGRRLTIDVRHGSMVANTIGIQMPADFPLAAYNDIHSHTAPLQPRFPDAFRHYAGAWKAVAIRFRSAAEADDVFQSSLNEQSSVEQRFRQEVALFQFFTSSVSVLDSCAYALHAIGNMIDAAAFPLTGQSLRTANFRGVGKSFVAGFPADSLAVALVSINADTLATELRDFRNFLTHRVASSRSYVMPTTGPNPPVRWEVSHLEALSGVQALPIASQLTGRYRSWVIGRLDVLFAAINSFVRSRL